MMLPGRTTNWRTSLRKTGGILMSSDVLRPCDIAKRWSCSLQHVRALLRRGDLPSFRAGAKLYRVKLEEVERWESRNSGSCSSGESTASLGKNADQSNGYPSAPRIVRLPTPR